MRRIWYPIIVNMRMFNMYLEKKGFYEMTKKVIISGLIAFSSMGVMLAANAGSITGVPVEDMEYSSRDIEYLSIVPDYLRQHVIEYTRINNVPISILVRLIYFESRWNPNVVSKANTNGTRDYGLAQINGNNIKWFAKAFYHGREQFDPMNPYHAIEACAKHLRYLNDIFLGNWDKTVKAYNCGVNGVLRGNIPYSTRIYTRRILEENIDIM